MSGTRPTATLPLTGPCAGARNEVDKRCADAERLAQAAIAHQRQVRDVKKQLLDAIAARDGDAMVRDRRQLSAAKDQARSTYRASIAHGAAQADGHEAARVWLREIDRLNRQLSVADRRAEEVVRRANELEQSLAGVELAADAARIAAEAAQDACVDARRALAACEEKAQRSIHAAITPQPGPTRGGATAGGAAAQRGVRPISLVLRGDRQTVLALAVRMAEETGVEAGRLQLLLLELGEQIAARALEENALGFPDRHPFWSQFGESDGRQVVVSLASMGYRFDGLGAWVDDRAPTLRELAVALSHVGYDSRSLRHPIDQQEINKLWQGTVVLVDDFLARRARDLDLEDVMDCLGARAGGLAELWDMWGRLRQLLLTPV